MCIPIIFGCTDKLKVEPTDDGAPHRICPNCHNASVRPVKSTTWFELFWLPLIPFSSKHIWLCGTCNWRAQHANGQYEPPIAGAGGPPHHGQGGYQPSYMPAQPSASYQPSGNKQG
ncbi:hypothetical protein HMN09_01176900 [Mycena chlorophos]|uniref:Zinc-ribbon 15 domain-containing protein n=1 Tax=Mycena chlorophos TaxID=658473 RepID=A0A8H6S6J5_MYCCL|nr:hypothetical protein HMN09_01176900 [Mycena chlorophos]